MTDEEVPQQIQDQIGRLQQLQSQLQMIQQQRYQIETRLKEIDEALEETQKATEKTPIYKSVGSILIKSEGKESVISDLKSSKESLDVRKNTLHKQEGITKEKLTELQSKVENYLKLSGRGNA